MRSISHVRVAALLAGLGLLAGCGSDDGDPGVHAESTVITTAPRSETTRLATSMTISEVSIFQALKITLERDGVAVAHELPILAGRDALVRVYVKPTSNATTPKTPTGPVTAILEIGGADGTRYTPLTDTKAIAAASSDATLDSTFNFVIPAASLPMGATFNVALTDPQAAAVPLGTANAARFPADGGEASLEITKSAQTIKVVLVPIKYDVDGSGRLPDTSPEQIERYKAQFRAIYPISDIDLTVHAPHPVASGGFGSMLRATVALRAADNPSPETYYYGAFNPKDTFAEYCSGGCITGLSGIIGPDNVNSRASTGVGFTGNSTARTMSHEIGHAHGRRHSPCGGAGGADPAFPHAGATIGLWGYDPRTKALVDPAVGKDVMSYCRPAWISDYTFGKLFDRLSYVNEHAAMEKDTNKKLPYRFVEVDENGRLTWAESITLPTAPDGEAREVRYEDAAGQTVATATAHLVTYDHLPGGFLYVPEQSVRFDRIAVEGFGRTP